MAKSILSVIFLLFVSVHKLNAQNVNIIKQQPVITPGPNVLVTSLLLTYAPSDQGIPSHIHSGPVVAYVIEGEMLVQLKGQQPRIIRAGEVFIEMDGDVHMWGANALNSTITKAVATIYGRPEENFFTVLKDQPFRETYENALAIARKNERTVPANAPTRPHKSF